MDEYPIPISVTSKECEWQYRGKHSSQLSDFVGIAILAECQEHGRDNLNAFKQDVKTTTRKKTLIVPKTGG
jgi:hypothetical protein